MTHGMPALFARLWSFGDLFGVTAPFAGARSNRLDREDMTEQHLRDIGLMDGRAPRSALSRYERRRDWRAMEPPPRL